MCIKVKEQIKLNDLLLKNKDLVALNRKLTTELIEVKQEKAHNEQVLDSIQNALADNGYKLADINE